MGEKDNDWGDDLMNDLERRFNALRELNAKLKKSTDKNVENDVTRERDIVKEDTIQLVAD